MSARHRFDIPAVFPVIVVGECRRRSRAVVLRNPFVPPCQNNYLGSDIERVLPLSVERRAVLSSDRVRVRRVRVRHICLLHCGRYGHLLIECLAGNGIVSASSRLVVIFEQVAPIGGLTDGLKSPHRSVSEHIVVQGRYIRFGRTLRRSRRSRSENERKRFSGSIVYEVNEEILVFRFIYKLRIRFSDDRPRLIVGISVPEYYIRCFKTFGAHLNAGIENCFRA